MGTKKDYRSNASCHLVYGGKNYWYQLSATSSVLIQVIKLFLFDLALGALAEAYLEPS